MSVVRSHPVVSHAHPFAPAPPLPASRRWRLWQWRLRQWRPRRQRGRARVGVGARLASLSRASQPSLCAGGRAPYCTPRAGQTPRGGARAQRVPGEPARHAEATSEQHMRGGGPSCPAHPGRCNGVGDASSIRPLPNATRKPGTRLGRSVGRSVAYPGRMHRSDGLRSVSVCPVATGGGGEGAAAGADGEQRRGGRGAEEEAAEEPREEEEAEQGRAEQPAAEGAPIPHEPRADGGVSCVLRAASALVADFMSLLQNPYKAAYAYSPDPPVSPPSCMGGTPPCPEAYSGPWLSHLDGWA